MKCYLLLFCIVIVFTRCGKRETTNSQNEIKYTFADVFILAGQSNALGQNQPYLALVNLPAAYSGIQPYIYVWRNGNYDTSTNQAGFENMQVPLNTRDKIYNSPSHPYNNITGWGVEQSWLHRTQQHLERDVYLLKNAIGALSISKWDTNDAMYFELNKMISGTISALKDQGKIPIFRGMVWMQGESDISNPNYCNALKNLINNVRGISLHLNNMPFIIIRIVPGTNGYSTNVDTSYNHVVKLDTSHNFIIDPTLIPGVTLSDNLHYDDASKLILGDTIFKFQKFRNQLN
jgi:hypothetical protein